ncbi:MAG: hypothetical protein HYZ09_00395 [Candidatus Kerfeldbacteria bacterium]|nr:hypothetical protein [Candidatus Kerfeldbacteria bacterium]
MPGRESVRTMIQLATTAFGLVAALAWNEAIKSLFTEIIGQRAGVISQFVYAIVVTIIVVLVTSRLGKLAERVGVKTDE